MSDSLAIKVAEFQRQRILNRDGMSSIAVVTTESDEDSNADRIVVDAVRGEEDPENSGIFRFKVTSTVKVRTLDAETVDAWLAEIDATQTSWAPGSPSAEYTAALAALDDIVITNDQDSTRETRDKERQLSRTFDALASEA